MSEYQWDFGSVESGLQFKVVYDSVNQTFTVTCQSGYMDLNALWFSDGDKNVEGTVTLSKSDSSLNLNGTGITWDDYYKVSSTGLGSAGESKESFLTAGESMTFTLATLDLPEAIKSLLNNDDPTDLIIGVRATSTSSGEGKFVDTCGSEVLAESVNRAPTLGVVSAGTVNDTAGDDDYPDVTGTLTGSDPDGDTVTFELAGSTATGDTDFDVQKSTDYGTFYLNTMSGAYKFVADDTAVEAFKTTQTVDFVVNATDGVADSEPQTISIALNGVNDTPTLNAVSGGTVNDTAGDDDYDDVTGTLTGSDLDGDTVTFELAGSTATGDTDFDVQKSTDYGTFYLNTASGAYKFVADDTAVEALKTTQTVDFVVNATDGTADSTPRTLTISLNGVNDTPELSATLTVQPYTDTAGDDTFASVTGSLSTVDRDAGDTVTYAIEATGVEVGNFNVGANTYQQRLVGTYGTLYLSSAGAYEYAPLDAAIEALEANASEGFTLSVTDGSNATDTVTLTINLTGAQDAPDVTPVVEYYTDTAADDNFDDKTGTLSVTSRDGDTSFTFALAGSSASLESGYDLQNTSSAYGTLYLNSGSGAYKFVANDGAIEALQWGSDPSLVYQVTATADGVTSASQTVTINITGDNDAARDIALLAVSSFANGNGTPGASTAIGTLSVPAGADPDNGGAYTFSLDSAKVGTLGSATIATDASALFSVSSAGLLSTTAAGGLAGGSIYEVTVKVAQGAGDTLAVYSETFSIVTGTNAASENLPGSGFDFGTGDDVIYGRQNIDIIYAGSGNDTVFGQGGNDEIHGGAGVDLLYGGNDNDTFVFSSGDTGITLATADTIADFSSADDVITTSLAANNVTIADGSGLAGFDAFVAAVNAEFGNVSGKDAYMAWNAAGSENGWLAIDENGSGTFDTGDTLIVLTGVNTAGEFSTTDIA
ncbi:beta strand repeat-containing protein [Pseudomonas oryzae]|uniref:VCBS repeat-containing protein n=1 Tax=Pseudomonas oryzae TaxID=1392877 RepID=A0A1H1TTR2_9PSED|nr:VCBS domain-containing protein [Pseudomonas oryzae]SDS63481.1 VCBS repeat-containing protein [Pseudomonas oryzae]